MEWWKIGRIERSSSTYVTATDMIRFCPDSVHPGSDTTGESNKVIANVYIDALRYII